MIGVDKLTFTVFNNAFFLDTFILFRGFAFIKVIAGVYSANATAVTHG